MPRARAGPSANATTNARRRGRTAYNLTCANCRTRKIKCDSYQPECRICLAYGERCHYDKPPPMSQVLAMANRIQELEKALEEHKGEKTQGGQSPGELTEAKAVEASPAITPPTSSTSTYGTTATASPTNKEALEAQVQENSPYYGSTSAVQEPTKPGHEIFSAAASVSAYGSVQQQSPLLSERQIEFWEDAAISACTVILQLPRVTITRLLRTHWTWIHPNSAFVPKHAFLRDAATGGQHFSELLLAVICLHSTRFTDHGLSDQLAPRVRLLLGRALHAEPSLSTVQALLQLSAYEIGKGASSQAWLYSGMAFRMAVDLGIFAVPKNQNPTDIVKLKVIQQLAWSSYLWDKSISLYLGRVPVLQEQPSFDPPIIDDDAELDRWPAFHGTGGPEETAMTGGPVPSHTGVCFANYCKIGSIINDILLAVYAKKCPSNVLEVVQQIKRRLDAWRSDSPQYLCVDASISDGICPPPHILVQKYVQPLRQHVVMILTLTSLLYWTATILLHRPFRASESCRSVCHDAAGAVENLLLRMDKSFGLSRATYLMAYCAYTAATVAVLDWRDGVPGQHQRVNTYLRALYGIRISCPSIQRSIDIILRTFDISTAYAPFSSIQTDTQKQTRRIEHDPLPAFFFDQSVNFAADSFSDLNTLPFGELDSFPLEWMDVPNDLLSQF